LHEAKWYNNLSLSPVVVVTFGQKEEEEETIQEWKNWAYAC